jgi:hypothetical protein
MISTIQYLNQRRNELLQELDDTDEKQGALEKKSAEVMVVDVDGDVSIFLPSEIDLLKNIKKQFELNCPVIVVEKDDIVIPVSTNSLQLLFEEDEEVSKNRLYPRAVIDELDLDDAFFEHMITLYVNFWRDQGRDLFLHSQDVGKESLEYFLTNSSYNFDVPRVINIDKRNPMYFYNKLMDVHIALNTLLSDPLTDREIICLNCMFNGFECRVDTFLGTGVWGTSLKNCRYIFVNVLVPVVEEMNKGIGHVVGILYDDFLRTVVFIEPNGTCERRNSRFSGFQSFIVGVLKQKVPEIFDHLYHHEELQARFFEELSREDNWFLLYHSTSFLCPRGLQTYMKEPDFCVSVTAMTICVLFKNRSHIKHVDDYRLVMDTLAAYLLRTYQLDNFILQFGLALSQYMDEKKQIS